MTRTGRPPRRLPFPTQHKSAYAEGTTFSKQARMFDQLFGKLSAVVHHRAAPYAAERARFLEDCARQGYSRNNLKKLAAMPLVAARELHKNLVAPWVRRFLLEHVVADLKLSIWR